MLRSHVSPDLSHPSLSFTFSTTPLYLNEKSVDSATPLGLSLEGTVSLAHFE